MTHPNTTRLSTRLRLLCGLALLIGLCIMLGGLARPAHAQSTLSVSDCSSDAQLQADVAQAKLLAWPDFLQFPNESLLAGKRILVVDDVWGSGRTITAVKSRVESAGGFPELCVLHYNPTRTLFSKAWPTYYAAITDARIVYPWEIDRGGGVEGVMAAPPDANPG